MPLYLVTLDDVGFTSNATVKDNELDLEFIRGFNDKAMSEGTLPAGVVCLQGASVSEDGEQQGEEEFKVFVKVALVIEAPQEVAADSFKPPREFLNSITDVLGSVDGKVEIGLEGNWETIDVEVVDNAYVTEYHAGFVAKQEAAPARRPRMR